MLKVGMVDYKIAESPQTLTTLGLGSCVGVCLIDPISKIAGMAHIMLPNSKEITQNSNPAKFADTCIEMMLQDMLKAGAVQRRMVCKIAGGSQMFSFESKNNMMKVGARNVQAVKDMMKILSIPIKAEDTGGNFGRTIEFSAQDGSLFVKTIGHGTKTM